MKTFSIPRPEFFEMITLGKENYNVGTKDLDELLKIMSTRYDKVIFGLLDTNTYPTDFIKKAFANKEYPVLLYEKIYQSNELFDDFEKKLSNPSVFPRFLDTLQANSFGIEKILHSKIGQYYLDDLLNYGILLISYMINELSRKLYGNEILAFEEQDKITTLVTYGIFRFILKYPEGLAKIRTIDLLTDSTVLLKSNKFKSRVKISSFFNMHVSIKARDFFELFVYSGLFSELLSKRQFIQGLSNIFTVPLVKSLFITPNYNTPIDNQIAYVNRLAVLVISDVLQIYGVYTRLQRLLSTLNPTASIIIDKCVHSLVIDLKRM